MSTGTILTAGLLFTAVGVGAVVLMTSLNRTGLRTMEAARRELREDAKRLPVGDVATFLTKVGMPPELHERAIRLLGVLSTLLQVPAGAMAADLPIRNLLAKPAADKIREPFANDLIYELFKLSDKSAWEQKWNSDPSLPKDDDSLTDFIMRMRIAEFLSFFAPLLRK